MSNLNDLFNSLPIGEIAKQLGVSEADASVAVAAALPSLVKGLEANAQDPAGAASLLSALSSKDDSLLAGGINLGGVDVEDGAKIVSHIFGKNTDKVATKLGGIGDGALSSDLMKKLMAILAPIVLAWVVKNVLGKATSGGGLGDILGQVVTGALGGAGESTTSGKSKSTKSKKAEPAGGGLGDILGSVLGGSSSSGGLGLDGLLGGLLGGGKR